MKKSFYELYLSRQNKQQEIKVLEESPKIRSPSKTKIKISYYTYQVLKSIILIIISALAVVGVIAILNESIRKQIIELLFGSSFLYLKF